MNHKIKIKLEQKKEEKKRKKKEKGKKQQRQRQTPDLKINGQLFIWAGQNNAQLFDYLAFNSKQQTDGKNELLRFEKDLKNKIK